MAAQHAADQLMTRTTESLRPDISIDPFRERSRTVARRGMQILGAQFDFECGSRRLLQLVDAAYSGIPAHRLGGTPPKLIVRLELTSSERGGRRAAVPQLGMLSGAGFLCGATARSNFVVLSPGQGSALIVVPRKMLDYPYLTRYELIEFAVFTLAQRVQGLVPLHAACVGRGGRGVLLMGGSGAGKSTLALHCWLAGFDLLSEDSTFVAADSMRATGVANFLHVRANSLRFLERGVAAMIRKSPIIRRRSGVEKFEVDVRRRRYPLAAAPLKLDSLIFISRESAGARPLLTPLPKARVMEYLVASQPYASSLPEWRAFSRSAMRLSAFELRRGQHPRAAVDALQELAGMQGSKSKAGDSRGEINPVAGAREP